MKGKYCSENAWAREGFFGKNWGQPRKITGLQGPGTGYPVSPCRVRVPPGARIRPPDPRFRPDFGAQPAAGPQSPRMGLPTAPENMVIFGRCSRRRKERPRIRAVARCLDWPWGVG